MIRLPDSRACCTAHPGHTCACADGHSWSLGPEIDGEQCCLYTDSMLFSPAEVVEGWKVWNGHDWADLYNVATRPGRIALSSTVRDLVAHPPPGADSL